MKTRRALKVGDRLTYHGREVEVLEVGLARAPLSGDMVELVRIRDPRRGIRGMFRSQLEAGATAPDPHPVERDREEGFRC